MRAIDLTGEKFGLLTVSGKSQHKFNRIRWECVCQCGNQCTVDGSKLRNGHTQSCGCLQKTSVSKAKKIDLYGEKFGRLTVIKPKEPDKWKSLRWLCRCECGKEKIVNGSHLRKGAILSCGCLLIDIMKGRTGANSPSYNPSLTDEDRQKGRRFPGYIDWSTKSKEKKDFTCETCQVKGGRLNSHHLFGYAEYPNLRLEAWNCAVLCEECHKRFHKKYGKKNNTLMQFEEFYKEIVGQDYVILPTFRHDDGFTKGFSYVHDGFETMVQTARSPELPQQGKGLHNALEDARWNRDVWHFLSDRSSLQERGNI